MKEGKPRIDLQPGRRVAGLFSFPLFVLCTLQNLSCQMNWFVRGLEQLLLGLTQCRAQSVRQLGPHVPARALCTCHVQSMCTQARMLTVCICATSLSREPVAERQ